MVGKDFSNPEKDISTSYVLGCKHTKSNKTQERAREKEQVNQVFCLQLLLANILLLKKDPFIKPYLPMKQALSTRHPSRNPFPDQARFPDRANTQYTQGGDVPHSMDHEAQQWGLEGGAHTVLVSMLFCE